MNDRTDRISPAPPTTSDPAALPADCARFRGDLSAYLDGGMNDEERRAADTHVAACPNCRRLADEVEAAERVLALGLDEDAAEPLPAGFAGAILARTVHEAPVAGRIRRAPAATGGLVPWLGWVAAAALVVFNLAVWNVDGPAPPTSNGGGFDRAPATVPASWQVSATLAAPGASDAPAASVHEHDDFAALFSAATLLDTFAETTGDTGEAAAFASRVIAYDDLLPRLGAIARDLPAEPAATVELTRGLLEDLASGDPRTHARLRQRLAAGELTAALRRLEVRLAGSA